MLFIVTLNHTDLKIITVSPKAQVLVNECVKQTNVILENPYNKPFEEKLAVWEKRIKWTKQHLQIWLDVQDEWLDFEPIFRIGVIFR